MNYDHFIAFYQRWFDDEPTNSTYVAAKFICAFSKTELTEIFESQQNLGWPNKVVRAAARMVAAA